MSLIWTFTLHIRIPDYLRLLITTMSYESNARYASSALSSATVVKCLKCCRERFRSSDSIHPKNMQSVLKSKEIVFTSLHFINKHDDTLMIIAGSYKIFTKKSLNTLDCDRIPLFCIK